jgi:nucleotide-binding universal stress UspA family protein
MTYARLMVQLELGRSNAPLLQVAADLALQFDAHLVGIATCQPAQMDYSGGYADGAFIQQVDDELRAETSKVEAEFRQAVQGRVKSVSWRTSVLSSPALAYIAEQARSADLFVTCLATDTVFNGSRAVNTGDLIMQLGRPVLVVPSGASEQKLARVLVGWKDTRECRRAIVDALPLLKKARHVALAEIVPKPERAAAGTRLVDVAGWLALHGVLAVCQTASATADDASALATMASDEAADVVVTGAYGHSRLREWALGGVTQDLLRRSDRCLMMSH